MYLAEWMSKKELEYSPTNKKIIFVCFIALTMLALWLPLFMAKSNEPRKTPKVIKQLINVDIHKYTSKTIRLKYPAITSNNDFLSTATRQVEGKPTKK